MVNFKLISSATLDQESIIEVCRKRNCCSILTVYTTEDHIVVLFYINGSYKNKAIKLSDLKGDFDTTKIAINKNGTEVKLGKITYLAKDLFDL